MERVGLQKVNFVGFVTGFGCRFFFLFCSFLLFESVFYWFFLFALFCDGLRSGHTGLAANPYVTILGSLRNRLSVG